MSNDTNDLSLKWNNDKLELWIDKNTHRSNSNGEYLMKNVKVEKPLILKRKEFIDSVVGLINNSELPAFIIEHSF